MDAKTAMIYTPKQIELGWLQVLTEWVRGVREKCICSLPHKKMMMIFGQS